MYIFRKLGKILFHYNNKNNIKFLKKTFRLLKKKICSYDRALTFLAWVYFSMI